MNTSTSIIISSSNSIVVLYLFSSAAHRGDDGVARSQRVRTARF